MIAGAQIAPVFPRLRSGRSRRPYTGQCCRRSDLFFAETASLHRLSPQLENRLTSNRGLFRGAGHGNPGKG
ncbi:hypothetical protein DDZ14_18895 [Maritimibacter sp. 55A14]|nr:hypothetical protein DDZ14_18895 [Maritimibacter sp. 55A14]